MVERILVLTLLSGGIYALLAVGFSLIFGVARVLNMAHTAFFMLAAYSMFYLVSEEMGICLTTIPAALITVAFVTGMGMLSYKLFIDRIREHPGAVLLITIALAMIIEQVLVWMFHADVRGIPFFVNGSTEILGMSIFNQHLLALGVMAVVIVIVFLLLAKTKIGISIRATANDPEIANLMGISSSKILLITMGIASALAAIAGVVVAPLWALRTDMWGSQLMMVMVIVVLGGLGSIKGSIIGAFIIGFVSSVVVTDPFAILHRAGPYLYVTFILLAMVIVLVVRPAGLFGTIFEEEKL
jgi:branched-chain amino acid transport system permease protein